MNYGFGNQRKIGRKHGRTDARSVAGEGEAQSTLSPDRNANAGRRRGGDEIRAPGEFADGDKCRSGCVGRCTLTTRVVAHESFLKRVDKRGVVGQSPGRSLNAAWWDSGPMQSVITAGLRPSSVVML